MYLICLILMEPHVANIHRFHCNVRWIYNMPPYQFLKSSYEDSSLITQKLFHITLFPTVLEQITLTEAIQLYNSAACNSQVFIEETFKTHQDKVLSNGMLLISNLMKTGKVRKTGNIT